MLTLVPIKQKLSTQIKSIISKCFLYKGNSKINRVKMIRIYIYLGVSDIKVIPIETEKKIILTRSAKFTVCRVPTFHSLGVTMGVSLYTRVG